MPSRGKILVTGLCFGLPTAGVVYQVLHYLIGLRRLGYDPYYIEERRSWVHDVRLDEASPDAAHNVALVATALESHGFAGRWGFRADYDGGGCFGMTAAEIFPLYGEADALLNVTGGQELREQHMACPRRIYVQSDPFALQVRLVERDPVETAKVAAHDTHFSFGENIGSPDCGVPASGFRWLPTRQPVALEIWGAPAISATNGRRVYTTITTWRNKVSPIELHGERYHWQKHLEFEKVLDLPRLCAVPLELAVGLEDDERRVLSSHGWRHKPMTGAEDLDSYRAYIQGSRAEFTVARDQYVRPRTGWFSDRSACYLAAGRPVITQETGFSKFLPTGRGLFAFTTMDEILAAVDAIESDYEGHCRAAREIAGEYFAAEKVVGSLLERAGL